MDSKMLYLSPNLERWRDSLLPLAELYFETGGIMNPVTGPELSQWATSRGLAPADYTIPRDSIVEYSPSGQFEALAQFESVDRAAAYFEALHPNDCFSVSIVPADSEADLAAAYARHFVCCGYEDQHITINGAAYVAIMDYGH